MQNIEEYFMPGHGFSRLGFYFHVSDDDSKERGSVGLIVRISGGQSALGEAEKLTNGRILGKYDGEGRRREAFRFGKTAVRWSRKFLIFDYGSLV